MPRRRKPPRVPASQDTRVHAWESRLRNAGLVLRCEACGKVCDDTFCRSCREDAQAMVSRPDRSRNGRGVHDDIYAHDEDRDPIED